MIEKENSVQKHLISVSREKDKGTYKKQFSVYIENHVTPDPVRKMCRKGHAAI